MFVCRSSSQHLNTAVSERSFIFLNHFNDILRTVGAKKITDIHLEMILESGSVSGVNIFVKVAEYGIEQTDGSRINPRLIFGILKGKRFNLNSRQTCSSFSRFWRQTRQSVMASD